VSEIAPGRNSDPGLTNIRNVPSPHWRPWLGVEARCAVPFSSFSENEHMPDSSRPAKIRGKETDGVVEA
jgi:putative SOS response-associated peptidase YedK